MRTTILTAAAAFALGGLVGAFALVSPLPFPDKAAAGWHQVRWPFPMDQWGYGTAYRCDASDCGVKVTVYLRAKIGFCDCTKGMTKDADLDRVSDFDLFGGALYAQAPGQPIEVAWMKGRIRPFAIRDGKHGEATMISVGLHDNCDALVATAVLERGKLAVAEPQVAAFLNGKTVAQWAEIALGL